MNLDEIKDLLKAVCETDVTELEVELDDSKVRIRRGAAERDGAGQPPYIVVTSSGPSVGAPAYQPLAAPGAPQHGQPGADKPAGASVEEAEEHTLIPAPIVGTFYESSSPGSPPFVE